MSKNVSGVISLVLFCLGMTETHSATWVQTTREDFLTGTCIGVDPDISPGELRMLKESYAKTFTNPADFEENLNMNVRIRAKGLILSRYGQLVWTYDQESVPALKSFISTWWDSTNGDMYFGTYRPANGFTILSVDGTARTFRPSGVWDTTHDYKGTQISSNPRISSGKAWYVWKDIETGDIIVGTDNGGLNIIHTHNTPDYDDDTVDVYRERSSPAILRADPYLSWKDEEGNLYIGFPHDAGFAVIHPDKTATMYTELGVFDASDGSGFKKAEGRSIMLPGESDPTDDPSMPRLISRTPRVGTLSGDPQIVDGSAQPLLKDSAGRLYVGTNNGLTVLFNDDADRYYDTSVTYRQDGLYDTTEDHIGVLIDPDVRIISNTVLYAWQDDNGDIYVRTDSGTSILHPDGSVTTEDPLGTVDRWRDRTGDVYISTETGVLIVQHPDGTMTTYDSKSDPPVTGVTKSWMFQDELYIVTSEGIYVLAPNTTGTSTSGWIDTREMPADSIWWTVNAPPGTSVRMQTRTAGIGSVWRDDFEGDKVPHIGRTSYRGDFDVEVSDGALLFKNFKRRIYPLIDSGRRFPAGSTVKAKVRAVSQSNTTLVYLLTDGEEPEHHSVSLSTTNEWVVLRYTCKHDFSRIGFLAFAIPRIERFEVDWVSVEIEENRTQWVDVGNPHGTVIPGLDKDYPYLQWRAIFITEDPMNALPALEEITIFSGYPLTATYISPAFDTQGSSFYGTISWDAEISEGTSLRFQIRSASTKEALEEAPWLGPSEDEEFYVSSGTSINPIHNGDRWIQYKAIFETKDERKMPVLKELRIEYEGVTLVQDSGLQLSSIRNICLGQNYPNPFNVATTIEYQMPREERVDLSIYNTSGQRIRTLVNGKMKSGRHSVVWNGADDDGRKVASGIYLYYLRTEGFVNVKKILLIE